MIKGELKKMGSHVIDMMMLKNNFGIEAMRQIWSDENRLAQRHKILLIQLFG